MSAHYIFFSPTIAVAERMMHILLVCCKGARAGDLLAWGYK